MSDMSILVASALLLAYLFPAAMAFAAASDLVTMTIPNALSLALIAGFLALAAVSGLGLQAILMHLAAGGLVLAVTFALFAKGWIGGGDAKLAAATALWLGFELLPGYMLLASLAGGLLTVVIVLFRFGNLPGYAAGWGWLRRIHDPSSGIPYGIALAAAALVVYPHSQLWLSAVAR